MCVCAHACMYVCMKTCTYVCACMYVRLYTCVYLLSFGPSRHRAWAVGQRPLECSLGSLGKPFGGLLEAALKPLGGRFGASWGLFWASGGLLGPLGGLLGASWGSGIDRGRGSRADPSSMLDPGSSIGGRGSRVEVRSMIEDPGPRGHRARSRTDRSSRVTWRMVLGSWRRRRREEKVSKSH